MPYGMAYSLIPGVTGVALVVLLSIMYVFASGPARRSVFPAFWSTHRLFPVIYALLFLHGSRGFLQVMFDSHSGVL